jgi:para-aminobenzoate synthetase/4-amino-4-deoxychorismate lyase
MQLMQGNTVNNPLSCVYFNSFDPVRCGWSAAFSNPAETCIAETPADIPTVIHTAERAAREGMWAVLFLSYEAAPVFDPAFRTHPPSGFPCAASAVFETCDPVPALPDAGIPTITGWTPLVSRSEYDTAIHTIRNYIAAGDTYQVNYTFPMDCRFTGDPVALYAFLCRAQKAPYCCMADCGRYHILSISPELFFERRGSHFVMRPMKGTMPRGRWFEEDTDRVAELYTSEKNRAENLMIVDLIRNDLGRIARHNTVRVSKLFEIERYETVLQMTSTVEGEIRPGISLFEIFGALFPCGSITGAPKIRTMQIIHELEPFPRSLYTGTIGFIRPGGDCEFNVAIRTVITDTETGAARFHVGGGITYDSTAENEYDECLTKSRFLNAAPDEFQLLESMLLDEGTWFILSRHLARLKASAEYFGFSYPTDEITGQLDTLCSTHPDGKWKVRLLLRKDGQLSIEAHPLPRSQERYRLGIARESVNSGNIFLFHKTTRRDVYEQARASAPGCDDVVLWNENGEITETTIANIVLVIDGQKYTPERTAGLLAGTFRDELIESGELTIRKLTLDDLQRAEEIYLVNSVRKWMKAVLNE